MMTLRQIRHFIAVAETGSISAATKTALISQSTLTLAIQQLEQEIGVGLFNRHAKWCATSWPVTDSICKSALR
jgi:DNA-binding transcriptional LysR family regulator